MDNVNAITQSVESAEASTDAEISDSSRKKFVKPEISVAVDVLEATTFFQLTDSGATN